MSLLQCMEVGEDWTKDQKATDIVLTPAACYPLYPTVATPRQSADERRPLSTCSPIASAMSPRRIRPASSCSACANMSAWARSSTSRISARAGWTAAWR